MDEILYDLGVDLHSSFQFVDGDLMLSSYNDNLVQSIVNRLKTTLDELDLFYDDYGSILHSFFGWKSTDETIGFMKAEILKVLGDEQRLQSYNVDIEYLPRGKIRIKLELYPVEDISLRVNLVLTETGIITIETDEITIQ